MKVTKNPSEDQLYDAILAGFRRLEGKPEDATTWEARSYVELMHLLKSPQRVGDTVINNSLLLLLALFAPTPAGVELRGQDVFSLNPTERQAFARELKVALW